MPQASLVAGQRAGAPLVCVHVAYVRCASLFMELDDRRSPGSSGAPPRS
jgi:hypothetical protein